MLKRLIENWWTSTTERTFQYPFAALCQLRGETVIHVTRHCGMELGKDLITRSKDGTINAYQLKTCSGKRLGLKQWQNELSNQLADLVENPVVHVSVGSVVEHQPWIVVNGDIDEEVTAAIRDRNTTYLARFGRTLKVRVIGELIEESLRDNTAIWPQDPRTAKLLFECSLGDGKSNLDKNKIAGLLAYLTSLPNTASRAEAIRHATFAPLLVALATMEHARQNNWYAMIEGWVMCKSYIEALIAKTKINRRGIEKTIGLLDQLIESNLLSLESEVNANPRLLVGIFDYAFGLVRYRATIVVGLLCILELKRAFRSRQSAHDSLVDKLLKDPKLQPLVFGEGAVPFFFALIFHMRTLHADQRSEGCLVGLARILAKENRLDNDRRFPSAYIGVDEVLTDLFSESQQGFQETPPDSGGRSMWIGPVVDLLVKEGYRQALAGLWYDVSEIERTEFRPKFDWQYHTWRSEDGTTLHDSFSTPQSWSSLRKEIQEFDETCQRTATESDPLSSLLFLMVFPHRASRQLLRAIDVGIDRLDANSRCELN